MFDPEAFASQSFEGANATEFEAVPQGEYVGVIENPEIVPWKAKDGSSEGLKLTFRVSLDDADLKTQLERDTVTVRGDILLDLTESGGLAMGKGKNVNLGRLREAVGLNSPGKPFAFPMLDGQLVKVRVGQRIDKKDGKIYNDIKGYAPAS